MPIDMQSPLKRKSFDFAFWVQFFVLLIIGTAAFALNSSKFYGLCDDCQTLRYGGFILGQGKKLYIDLFESRPPLPFIMAWITNRLGDDGFYLMVHFFVFLSAFFIFFLGKKQGVKFFLIPALVFVVLISYFPITRGLQYTRAIAASFIIIAVCFWLLQPGRFSRMGLGLAFTLVFFTQPNEILCLIPFCLLAIAGIEIECFEYHKPKKMLWAALEMGLMAAIAALPFIFYLFWNGIFGDFWYQNFTYISDIYIVEKPFLSRFFGALINLYSNGLAYLLFALFVCSIYIIVQDRSRFWLLFAIVISIGFNILNFSISGRFSGHYWSVGLGLISLWFLVIYTFFETKLRRIFILFPILCAFLFCLQYIQAPKYLELFRPQPVKYSVPFKSQLEEVKGKKDRLFVFVPEIWSLHFYTSLQTVAASKWVNIFLWYTLPNWDKDLKIFDSILSELEEKKCAFIIDGSEGDRNGTRPEVVKKWNNFLEAHFQKSDSTGSENYLPALTEGLLPSRLLLYKWKE